MLLIVFWTMTVQCLRAQHNLSFYPMRDQFNSFDYNPAFLSSPERFTFSIFPLAGFNLNANNQDILRDAKSKFLSGDVAREEYKGVFDKLMDRPSLHQSLEATYISFTYRSIKGFFNFRIKDRQFFGASLDGKLTDFIFKQDIRSVPLFEVYHYPAQAAHYREYSLGYSTTSRNKRLSLGLRGKIYFGKFAVYSSMEGFIGNRGNQYGLATTGLVNISYPADIILNPGTNTYNIHLTNSSISDYFWNKGNPGVGVDLGFLYRLNPSVNISMSVIDLGKINWKKNATTWDMTNAYPFYYATYGVEDVNGVPTITKREAYSYSDSFNFFGTRQESSSFSKALPATIYAGIDYEVRPGFTLGATNRYVVMKNLSYYSLALGATMDINDRLTLNTGYSCIGDSFYNIPLALLYRHQNGQIYAGTDNINILFTASGPYLASVNFGACFYLFKERNLWLKRSEQLPFYHPKKSIRNRETGLRVKSKSKK